MNPLNVNINYTLQHNQYVYPIGNNQLPNIPFNNLNSIEFSSNPNGNISRQLNNTPAHIALNSNLQLSSQNKQNRQDARNNNTRNSQPKNSNNINKQLDKKNNSNIKQNQKTYANNQVQQQVIKHNQLPNETQQFICTTCLSVIKSTVEHVYNNNLVCRTCKIPYQNISVLFRTDNNQCKINYKQLFSAGIYYNKNNRYTPFKDIIKEQLNNRCTMYIYPLDKYTVSSYMNTTLDFDILKCYIITINTAMYLYVPIKQVLLQLDRNSTVCISNYKIIINKQQKLITINQ